MQDNKPSGVRITVERITVTTVRSQNPSQKTYCDICKAQIESGELTPPPQLISGQSETIIPDHNSRVK